MSKYINYILILIGAVVALYANGSKAQNQYILISGIVVLMTGIYRLSKTIPSKSDKEDNINPEE